MKRTVIIFVLILAYSANLISQTENVGIGTQTPDASALLELSSTNKGLLIPRMDNAARNAIVSPADGLLIFNTTNSVFQFRLGVSWIDIVSGGLSFDRILNGTNTSAAMLVGNGATLAPTGSGIITANSYNGVLPIANGGTNSGTALNNNRLMISSAGTIVEAPELTDGQLLIGRTGNSPLGATLIEGANIDITSVAGSITIAATGLENILTFNSPLVRNTTNVDFVDGTVNGQSWKWDGDSWELALVESPLTFSNGLLRTGNAVSMSLGTVANQIKEWDGDSWENVLLSYNNGLTRVGNAIGFQPGTSNGQVWQWNGTNWVLADIQTTLNFLSPLDQAGDDVTFADGTVAGQVWRWNGTAWELAITSSLPTGTAEGNTLRWNNTTSAWEQNTNLVINLAGVNLNVNTTVRGRLYVGAASNPGILTFYNNLGQFANLQIANSMTPNRTYLLPDVGVDASFIFSSSSSGQTITGDLNVENNLDVESLLNVKKRINIDYDASNPQLSFEDSDKSNQSTFKAGNQTSNFNYILPSDSPVQDDVLQVASVAGSTITLEWSQDCCGGGAIIDLDEAYQNGNTINVGNNAVKMIKTAGASNSVLDLTTAETSGALYITNTGTGNALSVYNGTTTVAAIDDEGNILTEGFFNGDTLFIEGGAEINGKGYFRNDVSISDSLFVRGKAAFNDSLLVKTKTARFWKNILVEDSLIVKDSLYAGGNAEFNKQVYIPNMENNGGGTSYPVVINGIGQLRREFSSSRRYKKEIEDLEKSIDVSKLFSLRPVTFIYKETNLPSIGLIAEEVNEIYPELVIFDAQGRPDGVKYQYLSILLLENAKKQDERLNKMEKEIEELKSLIMEMKNK